MVHFHNNSTSESFNSDYLRFSLLAYLRQQGVLLPKERRSYVFSRTLRFKIELQNYLSLSSKQLQGFLVLSRCVWSFNYLVTLVELLGDYDFYKVNQFQKVFLNELFEGSFNELQIMTEGAFK